ncbi:transposable element Tcb1 transposase [Trichonephila clavipes]|nr:transposable element Tcb1 transposase [Trichonephila clavipes]
MDWPAQSPDLNPIGHVWDFLGRRLAARTLPPVTIRELRLALQDEWAAMPQQLIDTLILSMGRRCETCLAILTPHCKTHTGLTFDAPARAPSVARGNENPDVGLECKAFQPNSGNTLQRYFVLGSVFQNLDLSDISDINSVQHLFDIHKKNDSIPHHERIP